MTHRGNVVLIDADQPMDAIVTQMLAAPYTRIPVYRGEPDNIVGVVHAKDLFRAVKAAGGPETVKIDEVMTPPWFIPESTMLFDQLQAFRARHEHFAIVVDEYGALRGIVTLEDIIEEITGDIEDEHDAIKRGVVRREDGSLICQGDVPIRDLNREFGWGLPEDVAITIAGLVLHEARRIPEVGQTYAFYGFRFEILKREGTRIAELRIVPPAAIQAANSLKHQSREDLPCRFRRRSGDSTCIRVASPARASSARTGCGTSRAASPTRRPTSIPTNGAGRSKPGDFVHDMSIRLTVDHRFTIVDVEAVTDKSPYQICGNVAPDFKKLIGLAHRRRLPPRGAGAAGRRARLHAHRRAFGPGGDHGVPDRVVAQGARAQPRASPQDRQAAQAASIPTQAQAQALRHRQLLRLGRRRRRS